MSLFDQLRRSLLGSGEQTSPKVADAVTPAAPAKEEKTGERRRRRRIDARTGTRVLIIDDSPTIVAALRKLLVSAKYVTYEAFDAESGLKLAQEQQPDLIFLDIVLPGMNGFAALRLMRRDPKTQHIPIVMISGNEQATEQFYANRIGADDFMKKPFSRFEVFARIERLLDSNNIPRRKGTVEEGGATAAKETTANPQPVPAAPSSATPSPTPQPQVPTQTVGITPPPVTPSRSQTTFTAPPTTLQHAIGYGASAVPGAIHVSTTPTPSASAPGSATAPPQSSPPASPLDARKELTAMGLQYFDQEQFIAAIKRGDKLAFELFVAGGGVDLTAEVDGKTPMQIARENGRTQIFALLRSRLASTGV